MKLFGLNITKATTPKPTESAEPSQHRIKANPVGIVGLRESSGIVDEEFLYDLRWPQAGAVYQEMASNDAVVGASLYLIETLIRSVTWKAIPSGSAPQDKEAADFLTSCMNDMEDSWDDFICNVLSMLTYGFSFHEILYKVRRGPLENRPTLHSKYTDGRIGWRSLPIRSQATLDSWVFDKKTGRAVAFRQDPSRVGAEGAQVDIPIQDNLLFRLNSTRGNPEGTSLLRRCYRSWYFKRYIEELEGIGIERSLAGVPVLQPDEATPLFDKNNPEMVELMAWAESLVNGLRQDANHGVILPYGWELKLLGPEGKNNLDTNQIINRHETRIAMTMLSDLILLGDSGSGSFALSETKQDLLTRSITAIINSICAVLNTQAVPKLFALNSWQLEEYPQITTDTLKPPTLNEVALLLRASGLDITSNLELYNMFMKLLNAPTATTEEEMAQTLSASNNSAGASQIQDEADNKFKQSDMSYT